MFVKKFPSGWCTTGHHSRCPFILQKKATVAGLKGRTIDKPEIRCDCTCHNKKGV